MNDDVLGQQRRRCDVSMLLMEKKFGKSVFVSFGFGFGFGRVRPSSQSGLAQPARDFSLFNDLRSKSLSFFFLFFSNVYRQSLESRIGGNQSSFRSIAAS